MDLATTDRGGAVGIRVYRPFASMVMAVCAYCRCRIRAKGCRLSEFAGESRARGDAVRRGGGGRTERTRPAGPGGAQATTRHHACRRGDVRYGAAPVGIFDRGPPVRPLDGRAGGARAAYLLDTKARTG